MKRLGYLLADFPVLTETYPGNEIRSLERLGHEVRPVVINRHSAPCQPDDQALASRATHLASLPSGPRVLSWPARGAVGRAEAFIRSQRSVSPVTLFYEGARIAKQLRRDKVSHLHAHGNAMAAAQAIVAARLAEITVSFRICHGSPPDCAELAACLEHAEFAVASSIEEGNTIRAHHKGSRVIDIRPGVDEKQLKPYVTGAHNGRLLFAGSLREDRGVGDLLTALARLPAKERPHLEVVGDGPLRHGLPDMAAKAGLQPSDITCHGPKTATWLSEHGPGHLGLVAPARMPRAGRLGSRGLVVKEAMAMGLPVITTAITGLSEVVEPETGWLTPPQTPDALTQAIRQLTAQKPERRWNMARQARSRIEAHFTLGHSARSLSQAIEGLN